MNHSIRTRPNHLNRPGHASLAAKSARSDAGYAQGTALPITLTWVLLGALLCVGMLSGCNGVDTSTASAGDSTSTAAATTQTQEEPEQVCTNCGEVVAINARAEKGEATGAGAVMGAVIGGVIGHQFGSGSGNDAATAGGAAAGAAAGNEIERRRNSQTVYDVVIALDSGGQRTITVENTAGLSVGDDVRVDGTTISRV